MRKVLQFVDLLANERSKLATVLLHHDVPILVRNYFVHGIYSVLLTMVCFFNFRPADLVVDGKEDKSGAKASSDSM